MLVYMSRASAPRAEFEYRVAHARTRTRRTPRGPLGTGRKLIQRHVLTYDYARLYSAAY